MPQFKKRVASPGAYQTPDGVSEVTPARVQHWHETIQAMLAEGHKPPVSWGHARSALPHGEDDAAYWSSRLVAGKVTGSEIDPATGELVILGDAPGVEVDEQGRLLTTAELPDGRRVRTAIEEVSIGAMDWTDGRGRTWPDAPVHLALTPLPVWVPEGGQPPFEPGEVAPQQALTRFGSGSLLYRFGSSPVADEPKKEGDGKPDEGGGGAGVTVKKVIDMLGKVGITLPGDTDESNLLERLYVACTAKEGDMGGGEDLPPPAEPAGGGAGGTFMSTVRDPALRLLLDQAAGKEKDRRLERIHKLEGRGLPVAVAKELRAEVSRTTFSTVGGRPSLDAPVDAELSRLERALPEEGFGNLFARQIAGAAEVPAPEGQTGAARSRELAEEMARARGLPSRNGTNGRK